MTNEEYNQKISTYIDSIEDCIDDTLQMAIGVIGKSFIPPDFCFCGLMDRSIQLARGFIQMLRDRNLTCAGAMLRLQLDNCLRLYAINIAEDEQAVVDNVMSGKSIGKLKDKNGKKMTDAYLKEQISQYDKQLSVVYDNASGFIHFSSKAVFQSVYECQDNRFRYQVGGALPEKRNDTLVECAAAYRHYYRLFLHLLKGEAEWKTNFDESMEGK